MKRILFSILTYISLSGTAFAAAQPFYGACLDCDEQKAKNYFKIVLMSQSCDPDKLNCNPNDQVNQSMFVKGHVFTDTEADKGYSFMGSIDAGVVMVFPYVGGNPTYAKDYFNKLNSLREIRRQKLDEIGEYLESLTGFNENSVIDFALRKNGDDCPPNRTPFAFFLEGNLYSAISEMNTRAQNLVSEVNIAATEIFGGTQFGPFQGGVNAVIETAATRRIHYGNGGYIVFDLYVRGNEGWAEVNLASSRIGGGFIISTGQPIPSDASVSAFVTQTDRNSFRASGNRFHTFDACVLKEITDAMQSIGQSIDMESFAGVVPHCSTATAIARNGGETTYTWTEYIVETYMIGNTVYGRLREVTRTHTVSNNENIEDHRNCPR